MLQYCFPIDPNVLLSFGSMNYERNSVDILLFYLTTTTSRSNQVDQFSIEKKERVVSRSVISERAENPRGIRRKTSHIE